MTIFVATKKLTRWMLQEWMHSTVFRPMMWAGRWMSIAPSPF